MTDEELRVRIERLLFEHRVEATAPGEASCVCEHKWRHASSYRAHVAQAVIADLGLTVETTGRLGVGAPWRVVGQWEEE